MSFFRTLSNFEKLNPTAFWLITGGLGLSLNFFFLNRQDYLFPQTEAIQTTLAQKQALSISGGNLFDQSNERKKFNLLLHIALEREFPDFQERIDYEKKQETLLRSVQAKQKTLQETGTIVIQPQHYSKFYTNEELNAIDYYQGTGFYKQQQDLSTPPNKYDTRQTFLLKMHDSETRGKFLKSFKQYKTL